MVVEALLDALGRQAGLTGRYLVSGVGGLGAAFANPLAYGMNKGLEAAGSDYRFPDQYEALQRAMTEMGLPEPEGTVEKAVGFASELGVPDPTDSARVVAALSHMIDPNLAMALVSRGKMNDIPDLPMDEASRMQRAKEMGFDTDQEWYHGTTHDISKFNTSRSEPGSHFGSGTYLTSSADDASRHYAGEGPDLTNRIQRKAEQIADDMGVDYDSPEALNAARKELKTHEGAVMPVKTRAENTFDLGEGNNTRLDFDWPDIDPEDYLDEAGGDMELAIELAQDARYEEEPTGALVDFMEAIRYDPRVDDPDVLLSKIQEIAFDEGGISGSELDRIMRETEWWAEDDYGELVNNEVYRAALEAAGFDSARHPANIFNGMEVEDGAEHLIMFDPAKIRSRFAKFDPAKKDSKNILASHPAATVLGGSLAAALLAQQAAQEQ